MVKQYTVVLVQTPAGTLLINRLNPPYIGLWNGLGGKVEAGESPEAGARREVQEEAGLTLSRVQACGLVHWFVDGELRGDLHLFAGQVATQPAAAQTREGVLATWPDAWLHDPENLGLVPDLKAMLPLFAQPSDCEFDSHFEGERFLGLEARQ